MYKEVYRKSRGEHHIITSLQKFLPDQRPGDNTGQVQFDHINNALSHLTQLGFHGLTSIDLTKLLPDDQNAPALEIMSEVRAYFQGNAESRFHKILGAHWAWAFFPVAYKRFADNIPKQIDSDFIQGTDKALDLALMDMELSREQCAVWLQEDPEEEQRREDLMGRKKRLESAKAKLGAAVRMSAVDGVM